MICYSMGDIHGYSGALEEALAYVNLSDGARLILLGDYIDYGPDSGGALRRVWGLQREYGPERVIALRGNHEDALGYHGVFWDGKNHYYIDGSVQGGGRLNVLAWDREQGYRQWDDGWRKTTG